MNAKTSVGYYHYRSFTWLWTGLPPSYVVCVFRESRPTSYYQPQRLRTWQLQSSGTGGGWASPITYYWSRKISLYIGFQLNTAVAWCLELKCAALPVCCRTPKELKLSLVDIVGGRDNGRYGLTGWEPADFILAILPTHLRSFWSCNGA